MPKCLKPVYYLQADPKWGSKTYKSPDQTSQDIAHAGCGITCSAMVIATLCPDSKTTPAETAKWSMKHNYKSSDGTKWEYFVPQMKVFNISCKQVGHTDSGNKEIKAALRSGECFVITSMTTGNWTSSRGHFILAYYMDENYVYINDPASTKSHRTKNKISLYTSQAKQYWVISHKGEMKEYTGSEWDFGDDYDSSSDDDGTSGGSFGNGYTNDQILEINTIDRSYFSLGNSSLASYVNRIAPKETDDKRSSKISCITVHSANTTGNLSKLAKLINSGKINYNYGINENGQIGLFVDEPYPANSTGNKTNDNRSVNIVCMNSSLSPNYEISEKCFDSLVDLCEDICRRNYIESLVYNEKKPGEGTLTLHSQFDKNVSCPGKYITKHIPELIERVNSRLHKENMQKVTVTSWQADSDLAALRAQSTVSLGAVKPYVARLAHDEANVNYKALVEMGVVGILFHGGTTFDGNTPDHNIRKHFMDIHVNGQWEELKKSKVNLPYALDYWARSTSMEEAKLECENFYYLLSYYRPKLGAWVRCRFNKKYVTQGLAISIIDYYYECFCKWGFKARCGIIATKEQAEWIKWPRQATYMPLWLEGEKDELIETTSEEVLTPSYFKLDDLKNKGFNESRDRTAVDDYVIQLRKDLATESGSDDYNDDGSNDSSDNTFTNNRIDKADHGEYQLIQLKSYPDGYTGFKAGECWTAITSTSSPQWKMCHNNGMEFDSKGFCKWGGRFGVAVGSAICNTIGTYIDVILENGTEIPCVMFDQKADRDTLSDNIFMSSSHHCCSEFTIDWGKIDPTVKKMGDCSYREDSWKGKVKAYKIYKKNWLKKG